MSDKRKNNGGHSTAGKAGRKSIKDEIKAFDLASPHVEDAFKVVAGIMMNKEENSRDRIAASKLIIEYVCVKPEKTIELNHNLSDFNIKDIISFKD
jgi:hypothetical protein